MNPNTAKRDIRHEMADVIQLLGDEYTTTTVECDPGDTAIKITRHDSGQTMYIVAYSNPADTEILVYDENGSPTLMKIFFDGALNDLTPEETADYITQNL